MIEQLAIRRYRCFEDFGVTRLGRVNLVVGRNCAGKTALLEAIETATSPGSQFERLWASVVRRGERFPEEDEYRPGGKAEYDIRHLFHGHRIGIGASFEVSARGPDSTRSLSAKIVGGQGEVVKGSSRLFPRDEFEQEGHPAERIGLLIESSDLPEPAVVPLTYRGGLRRSAVPSLYEFMGHNASGANTTLIATDSLTAHTASQYWKSIALTTDEDLVVEALRVLEPRVHRVAFVGSPREIGPGGRGGLLVLFKGAERALPIGSLGDGMWRMFCIAVGLIRSRNGILLVDEIDTGLHHSTMEAMWWLVLQTAERQNVQVFATTHSSDCVSSLAAICREARPGLASLQRVEAGSAQAVPYTEEEIWAAARHGIEMR